MNHIKFSLIACVYLITQPFYLIYAGSATKPPPPTPGHRNSPDFSFPGLGIEDYTPFLFFLGIILALYVFKLKQKVSIE